MRARFRSWWQKIKRPLLVVGIIVASMLGLALIVGIIGGYFFSWNWTGLRQKTLWDWLQLLIIPVVLALAGYVINLTISRSEQEATKQRAKTEQEIAQDNQRETALQEYIDRMSELIIEKKVRDSRPEDEVRTIARVRTLTVLPRLDPIRKRSVLQFLYESGLIDKDKRIIDLSGADLSRADLSGAEQRRRHC